MVPRISNFARDRNHRGIFEIVTSENSDRVKGLKHEILLFSGKSVGKIKGQNRRRIVRRVEADDFCVPAIGLRKKVFVRMNQVGQLHPFSIGVLSGAKHMTVQIDRLFREGHDWRDLDAVAVLNLKILQGLVY